MTRTSVFRNLSCKKGVVIALTKWRCGYKMERKSNTKGARVLVAIG